MSNNSDLSVSQLFAQKFRHVDAILEPVDTRDKFAAAQAVQQIKKHMPDIWHAAMDKVLPGFGPGAEPQATAAMHKVMVAAKDPRMSGSLSIVNLAVGFKGWYQRSARRVIRVTPDTAAFLRSVRVGFVPQEPPSSWGGDAIVIEGVNKAPVVDDVWSILVYRIQDFNDRQRYFFVYMTAAGVVVSSIYTDIGRINEQLALKGQLGPTSFVDEGSMALVDNAGDHEHWLKTLRVAQFVFATSYYLDKDDDRIALKTEAGPLERGPRKKAVRRNGKPAHLWNYETLTIRQPAGGEPQGELDKERLNLMPVIVAPYIRLQNGRPVIVDAHDSHRWKNPEKLGTKTTI